MLKFLRIIPKVLAVICLIYLFIGFVVVPLTLTWAVRTQAKKYINHDAVLKSASFNPLTFQLTLKGFKVLDRAKATLVAFDRFNVDVSFLSFIKKPYRIEHIRLDGFSIAPTLLKDGKVNLLALMPKETKKEPAVRNPQEIGKSDAPTPASYGAEIPPVVFDEVTIRGANIIAGDQTIMPNFITRVHDINIDIKGLTTFKVCQTNVILKSKLDEKGTIDLELLIKPFVTPIALEATATLNNYALTSLSPYVGKYTGRALSNGKFDFKINYVIADNKIKANHKILIQHFTFGERVESKDALHLPFGLAIALLEDPQGRISISLPVIGDMSDPKFEYFHLIGQVARNFFMKIITKPFSMLASMVGGSDSGTDEMGSVRFAPGKALLNADEEAKLLLMVKALNERPKLLLEINGSYDPDADWKAIKSEVFYKDFTNLKKDSTKDEAWIYQMLYQRRFGIRALWNLAKKYKVKTGEYREEMNHEIKKRIVEDAPADKIAMDALALERAKIVSDFLVKNGFDAKRLSIGQNKSTQASMGFVNLEFVLTVFEDKSAELAPALATTPH